MNRVLLKPLPKAYLLYCIHKMPDGYAVRSKQIADDGRVSNIMDIEQYKLVTEARDRIRTLVKLKQERKGLSLVHFEDVPPFVFNHFENEETDIVSNDVMLAQIDAAKRERYVTFSDVTGIENRFDLDVQYLALDTGFKETLDVTDKFGEVCTCFMSRFSSVELTEDGKEASKIFPSKVKEKKEKERKQEVGRECLTCEGKGKFMMCENHDRDCGVRAECFEVKCSCASQKLSEVTCRHCNGTGIIMENRR